MMGQLRRYWRQLTADKRKLSLMLVLVGVGLLLWGRLLLKDVPRTAMADPDKPVSVQGTTGLVVRDAGDPLARPTLYIDLPELLVRDLFALPTLPATQTEPRVILSQGPEKSTAPLVDDDQQASMLRRVAASLKLQTTMLGQNPRAMINGQLVAPGESIRGFTVKKILPRQVVLESGGLEVVLDL